jgi:hypothetical protein
MNRQQRRAEERAQAKANRQIMMFNELGRSVSAACHPLLWKSAPTPQADVCKESYTNTQSKSSLNSEPVLAEAKAPEKTCTKCEQSKPLSEFSKAATKDGLRNSCKACAAREQRIRNGTEANDSEREGHKQCKTCGDTKPLGEFRKFRTGYATACNACRDTTKKDECVVKALARDFTAQDVEQGLVMAAQWQRDAQALRAQIDREHEQEDAKPQTNTQRTTPLPDHQRHASGFPINPFSKRAAGFAKAKAPVTNTEPTEDELEAL